MPHCTVRTDAGSLATRCGCAVDGVRAADARKDQSSRMHLTLRAEPRSGGRGQDRDWAGGARQDRGGSQPSRDVERAMRANDLWLRLEGGRLWLRAADVSPWAVLRRLARGLLGRGGERQLVDWGDIEFLRGNPRVAQAGGDYHRRIARLTPPAIARLADEIPYHHAAELLTLIPDATAADALEAMAPERQLQVFEDLEE